MVLQWKRYSSLGLGPLSPSTDGFSATFTIVSGTTTITGSKAGTVGVGGVEDSFMCVESGIFATLTGEPEWC